ncbi:MFS transporter [Mangrovactinospora gilvigrisea]|uniref:MFS transporter n=1 Tax=Mangrovactinospora gilvigrisea TaxID=1428644 RepID=UPI000A63775E|nr:MFS transporter [Mangrovactinospora gilvigrisea]
MPHTAQALRPLRLTSWPPQVRLALAGTVLTHVLGFANAFLAYALTHRGLNSAAVSAVLSAYGAGWIAGQLAFGHLTDTLGRRRTLILANAASAVVLITLPLLHALPALLTGAFVLGAVLDGSRPAVSALINDQLADSAQRTRVNGWRHWCLNAGAALAGATGGLIADRYGYGPLFVANAASCAAFAVLAAVLLPVEPHRTRHHRHEGPGLASLLGDDRLHWLLAGSLCAFTCAVSLTSALPILMVQDRLPAADYGLANAANALAVLALTPPLTVVLTRRARRTPLVADLAVGSLILGAGMGGCALAHTTPGYLTAVVAATPGEIILAVAAYDVLARIAPAHLQGRYQGALGMALASAGLLAPALTSLALHLGGRPAVGLALAALGVLGALCCLPLHHRMPKGMSS